MGIFGALTTAVGGLRDVPDLVTVPERDSGSLRQALVLLLADEQERRRLGEAGRETAVARWSPSAASSALVSVYASAV